EVGLGGVMLAQLQRGFGRYLEVASHPAGAIEHELGAEHLAPAVLGCHGHQLAADQLKRLRLAQDPILDPPLYPVDGPSPARQSIRHLCGRGRCPPGGEVLPHLDVATANGTSRVALSITGRDAHVAASVSATLACWAGHPQNPRLGGDRRMSGYVLPR